jgi:hypothetical protein
MTMTAAAYNSLRMAANDESLSYGELAMIEAEFATIPDERLRDLRENATADDMLDEIAGTIGTGRPVFITDDMLIPACDLCEGPQYSEGDDWNGETGNHRSCEDRVETCPDHGLSSIASNEHRDAWCGLCGERLIIPGYAGWPIEEVQA